MDLQRFAIKHYLLEGAAPDTKALISVFHRWIQQHTIPDHLLIDVVDYSHVPYGPGVMLMAHEGHFSFDSSDGRVGLMYTRKQPGGSSFEERFRTAFKANLHAQLLLDGEADLPGGLVFKNNEWALIANDRLLVENTTENFNILRDELDSFLPGLMGTELTIKHVSSPPKERLTISMTTPQAVKIADLVKRLEDSTTVQATSP